MLLLKLSLSAYEHFFPRKIINELKKKFTWNEGKRISLTFFRWKMEMDMNN